MKIPKNIRRHCPYCNKHTEMRVRKAKNKGRNQAHPMSRGSKNRVRKRGSRRGYGNYGKFSKPPKPKMVGKKLSEKTDLRYQCSECKKMHTQKKGKRARRVEIT